MEDGRGGNLKENLKARWGIWPQDGGNQKLRTLWSCIHLVKPLKVAAAKTLCSSMYAIGTTCFVECYLFYVITGGHCFS